MKFAYSWLSELVDITLPAPRLAEFLSLHAFEAEVLDSGQEFSGIIAAKVTKIEKHPNADRLRVIELSDGKQVYKPVVCGAWNFDIGAIVPLALPGAVIPHDQHDPEGKPFTLGKATIRGIESQGMICSAKELGLSEEGSGILILDSSSKLGKPFSSRHQSKEILFDVSVPANRPDILSYWGVAWEIAALTGRKYKVIRPKPKISDLKSKILKVRISDPNCSRYIAVRLSNIKIGPSPEFIQERLKSSGLRPINNVVDITNYVMLETGQPLHAFDASKVNGAINIRKAYLNETITTLDTVPRKLTPEILLIADSKNPLAIAGVMGGAESAVGHGTSEIILEAGNFNAVSVRKTSKQLGLRTDASSRFERSLPKRFANTGAEYAVDLLVKYAQAKPLEYIQAGVKDEKTTEIKLDPEKVNSLLGANISVTEQRRILSRFGFTVKNQRSTILVGVPFWRPDVSIWEDLAEEVGRFLGLDKIPNTLPAIIPSSHMSDPLVAAADHVRDLLVGMGFDETYTYSFVPESVFSKYGIDRKQAVEIANPLTQDQKYLRTGIGMNYEHLSSENSQHVSEESLFEIGNVYRNHNGEIEEHTNLFLMCFSKTAQPAAKLVGSLAELFKRLGIKPEIKQTAEDTGEVWANGENLGPIRAVNEELKWAAAELNLEKLVKYIKPKEFRSLSKYPAIELDAAVLVRVDLPWGEIKKVILSADKLVESVSLFDIYQGKNISPDKKSLAFRVVYQAPDRTLINEGVAKIHNQILDQLKSRFNAQIRD